VAESAAAIAELVAWLADNGGTPDPEYLARATQRATEARAAAQPAAPARRRLPAISPFPTASAM
jgi:hypothetical protein